MPMLLAIIAALQAAAPATPSRQIAGWITQGDYPPASLRHGEEGVVVTRFTVGTDGRPRGCSFSQSSGSELLDATSCAIIIQRFRYEPARDAQGRPRREVKEQRFTWRLPGAAVQPASAPAS